MIRYVATKTTRRCRLIDVPNCNDSLTSGTRKSVSVWPNFLMRASLAEIVEEGRMKKLEEGRQLTDGDQQTFHELCLK